MTAPRLRPPPADCPVCGLAVTVTRVTCQACGTELTGHFRPCSLCGLGDDEVALVRELLVVGGDVDEVSRRTGLGPAVVRRRLLAAAEQLGHGDAGTAFLAPEGPSPVDPGAVDDDFLERLARGVVEADEALRHLP